MATASVRFALRFAPHPKASAALFLHTPCLTYRNCAFKKWSTEPFLVLPRPKRRRAAPEGSTTLRGVLGDDSRARRGGYRLNFSSSPKATARAVRIFFLCRWESRTPDPRREWDNPTASHRPRKEWDEPLTTRPATTEKQPGTNHNRCPQPTRRGRFAALAARGEGGEKRWKWTVDLSS